MLIKILGLIGLAAISFFGLVVFDLSMKDFIILLLMSLYWVVYGWICSIEGFIETQEAEEDEKM